MSDAEYSGCRNMILKVNYSRTELNVTFRWRLQVLDAVIIYCRSCGYHPLLELDHLSSNDLISGNNRGNCQRWAETNNAKILALQNGFHSASLAASMNTRTGTERAQHAFDHRMRYLAQYWPLLAQGIFSSAPFQVSQNQRYDRFGSLSVLVQYG